MKDVWRWIKNASSAKEFAVAYFPRIRHWMSRCCMSLVEGIDSSMSPALAMFLRHVAKPRRAKSRPVQRGGAFSGASQNASY
jgi:hypothetical protein